MKIIVEGKEVELELPDRDVTLAQVVREVEDFLVGVGKIPVTLNIDGKELQQEELEAREDDLLAGSEVLTFGVKTIFEFLREHLDGAAGANEELLKNITTFANEIHAETKTVKGEDLVVELNHFFDFWHRISRLLPDEVGAQDFNGKRCDAALDELRTLFEEVVGAMEQSDWVLAGDLLQYEVVPMVEVFHRCIPDVKAKVRAREDADRRELEKQQSSN